MPFHTFRRPSLSHKRSAYSVSEWFQTGFRPIGTSTRLIFAYHPHASDQEELKNRDFKCIFLKMIDQSLMDWSIKHDDSLLAYQNAFKTSIHTSHFLLVYGKAFHLYFMLENKALCAVKLHNMDASLVALERKYILLELEEYKFHA